MRGLGWACLLTGVTSAGSICSTLTFFVFVSPTVTSMEDWTSAPAIPGTLPPWPCTPSVPPGASSEHVLGVLVDGLPGGAHSAVHLEERHGAVGRQFLASIPRILSPRKFLTIHSCRKEGVLFQSDDGGENFSNVAKELSLEECASCTLFRLNW